VVRPVKVRVPAIAYLRTSSAANVGSDKDSDKRQREAIVAYARSAGLELVGEYYDAAVSGADPIDTRPGFRALLDRIVSNGVRTVIVEDASRFARTLMVQEAGIATLAGIGVQVLTSRGDDLTDSDDEMRVAMRQIAGVFSQLEKTRLVKKLAAARARGRAAGRKVEGRKGFAEMAIAAAKKRDKRLLDALAMAKRLRRANPKTGERRSLRDIATALAKAGHVSSTGRPYSAKSVRSMLAQRLPGEVFPSADE
jgi:DNA invertase Pin-like site-specific DNA recombinase